MPTTQEMDHIRKIALVGVRSSLCPFFQLFKKNLLSRLINSLGHRQSRQKLPYAPPRYRKTPGHRPHPNRQHCYLSIRSQPQHRKSRLLLRRHSRKRHARPRLPHYHLTRQHRPQNAPHRRQRRRKGRHKMDNAKLLRRRSRCTRQKPAF